MRITFSALHRDLIAQLERASTRLLDYQREVSSGKRVEQPSDDPSAASQAIVERGRQATIDQYTQSADSTKSRLTVVDSVLGDFISQLSAAEVSLTSARGTTQAPAQREAAARELESLRDSMLRDLNTSYRGTYLFGGAAGTTQPYEKNGLGVVSAYQGSNQQVSVDIDDGHEIAIAFDGEALAQGSDASDIFQVMQNAIDAVRANDDDDMAAAIGGLKSAFARASAAQSGVGVSLRTIEEDKLRHGEASRSSKARISSLEDANMAEAISGMTNAEAAYRAALGAAAQINRQSLMDYLK
jgi:flagellar hook-associated protein 3 FlgL